MYVRNPKRLRVCVYDVRTLQLVYLGKNISTAARLLKPGYVFAVADSIGRCAIEARWSAVRARELYFKLGWLGPGFPLPPLKKPTPHEAAIKPHRNGKH